MQKEKVEAYIYSTDEGAILVREVKERYFSSDGTNKSGLWCVQSVYGGIFDGILRFDSKECSVEWAKRVLNDKEIWGLVGGPDSK